MPFSPSAVGVVEGLVAIIPVGVAVHDFFSDAEVHGGIIAYEGAVVNLIYMVKPTTEIALSPSLRAMVTLNLESWGWTRTDLISSLSFLAR